MAAQTQQQDTRLADGQLDWSYGVDSSRTPTIASQLNLNGLPRNALSWANNVTTRGGGICQRTGNILASLIHDSTGLYQGGIMYDQAGGSPYLIVSISGEIWKVDPTGATPPLSLSMAASVTLPPVVTTIPFGLVTTTTAQLICPAAGHTATVQVVDSSQLRPGPCTIGFPTVWVLSIISVDSPTQITIQNNLGGQAGMQIVGSPVDAIAYVTAPAVTTPPLFNNPTSTQAFFVQGEEFVIIQSGDNVTLPLFWDGATLRRSNGLTGDITGTNINELPAAGPMVYYQGRIWYAQFRRYTAGDIVGGSAGTAGYQLRDSILKVTENPLAIGGDGFAVPSQAGNIRGLQYSANLDATLGQGTLFIFTRKQVYAMDVPITRADWINATGSNAPLQRVVQRNNGGVSDRSVVAMNGDLYYQSLEPGIRSLFTALRHFGQPGNKPISNNLQRALQFNDRGLMHLSTGVAWDNRLYMGILPEQRAQGVVHKGTAVMDFEPIGSFQEQGKPIWDGMHEGLDVLQYFVGDFGGVERMFAAVVSRDDDSIQLWEVTNDLRTDGTDHLVDWYAEFPAFTWGGEFDLKRLDGGEIWIDKLFGDVLGKVYYRVDANPCWQLWHGFKLCSARNSCEDVNNPVCYPLEINRESGKFPVTLPLPPKAPCSLADSRPMNIGRQFQVKIEMKGWCRLRGLIVYAVPFLKTPFGGLQTLPGGLPAMIP